MMKFCKEYWSADMSKVQFRHVIFAFLVSVILPALWISFEGNTNAFEAYQSGKSSVGVYLHMLGRKFLFIYMFGCFIALLFGTPAFYALRKLLDFNLLTVCCVAALIAILPNVLIEILSDPDGTYTVGDCIIAENGQRTLCGWQHFWLNNILVVALYGASAGVVFWLILRKIVEERT
jgi:hypothetical protein